MQFIVDDLVYDTEKAELLFTYNVPSYTTVLFIDIPKSSSCFSSTILGASLK